ncbi:hypothetical protein G4B88_029370 [Cannabis sativa]|uniref:Uncharacterized protein n=1 Tax=Cannabis sativa TaxID=3483 RepID=A0A7J6FZ66_CANSA|nr:hypothetical protein G4B88_029370 [Cannabis sativa]
MATCPTFIHALTVPIGDSPVDQSMSYQQPSGFGPVAWSQRGIGLTNTIHSEVAPCLPLPSLPVFCGASDPELSLFDVPNRNSFWALDRSEVLAVGNLREDSRAVSYGYLEPLNLHDEVLRFNPEAFDLSDPGPLKDQISAGTVPEKTFEPALPIPSHDQRGVTTRSRLFSEAPAHDVSMSSSRKTRAKKKVTENTSTSVEPDPTEIQDAVISSFCELVDDFCGKAEIFGDDQDEAEWLSLPLSDIRDIVNEIMSIRTKKLLHLLPVESLVRLLTVLDQQIHRSEGLSINDYEHSDSDVFSSIFWRSSPFMQFWQ